MGRPRRVRTVLAAAACALLLASLVACGGDDGSEGTASDTASASSPATSKSASPSESASGDVEPQQLLDAMKAALEKHRTTRFVMTFPGAMTAKGAMSYRDDKVSMDMTMSMPSARMKNLRMLVVDGAAYMSIPGQTPEGKLVQVDPSMPGMGEALSQLEQTGPQGTFDAFDAGLKKVQRVGEEQVGGEPMTHYQLTVDTDAAMQAQGKDPSAAAVLPNPLVYDMWLDERDLMRKVVYEASGITVTMTMDDWGEDVHIEAPDPADVVQLPTPSS